MRQEIKPSGAHNFGIAVALAIIAATAIVVGWLVGGIFSQGQFWFLALAFMVVVVVFQAKHKWEPRLVTFTSFALVAACFASLKHDALGSEVQLNLQKRAADLNRQHQLDAIRNHERRLAWNIAHPADVARMKAEARAKVAAAEASREHQAAAAHAAEVALGNRLSSESSRYCDSLTEAAAYVKQCESSSDQSVMTITIDSDTYESLSTQDKKLFRAYFFKKWYDIWRPDHPKGNAANAIIVLKDLTGDDVGTFGLGDVR